MVSSIRPSPISRVTLLQKSIDFWRYLLFFVFSLSSSSFAQPTPTPFDSAFNRVVFELISQNPVEAQRVTDSLVNNADNKRNQIRALLLLANLNIQANEHEDAMANALVALNIATKTKDYEWEVRSAGFLSSIFRDANLIAEARQYLRRVEKANKRLEIDQDYYLIQITVHHERSHFEWREGNYTKAIEELNKALALIPLLGDIMQPGYYSSNYMLLGENYLALGDYEKAKEFFHRAIHDEVPNQNLNYTAVYRGLADIELHHKNYEEAFQYLQQAESFLPSNQHFTASLPFYKSFARYYKEIDQPREALHYENLHIEALKSQVSFTERLSDRLVEARVAMQKKQEKTNSMFYVATGLLLALLIYVILRLRVVSRKKRRLFEELKKDAESRRSVKKAQEPVYNKEGKAEESLMLPETEERLLKELEYLESVHFYTQKDLSLTGLASELQTNTKYLSYIIHTHRGKDFNQYIHELRIAYAIDKLQSDPRYLNYKIAYIAEECGYSSHSKFTSVFKSITGLSPSAFISYLKEEAVESEPAVKSFQ